MALAIASCAEKKEDEYKEDLSEVASPSAIEKELNNAPTGIHESNIDENNETNNTVEKPEQKTTTATTSNEENTTPEQQTEANSPEQNTDITEILPKLKPGTLEEMPQEAETQPETQKIEPEAPKTQKAEVKKEEKTPTLYIIVSKKQQRLWIYEYGNKTPTHTWLVSTASEKEKCPPKDKCYIALTPNGVFTPDRAYRRYKSKQWKARMDFAVFFNGGIALHATYGEDHLSMLGKKDSGGCVRQSEENAQITFETVQKHGLEYTRVIIQD